jgi:hypothetical protein
MLNHSMPNMRLNIELIGNRFNRFLRLTSAIMENWFSFGVIVPDCKSEPASVKMKISSSHFDHYYPPTA